FGVPFASPEAVPPYASAAPPLPGPSMTCTGPFPRAETIPCAPEPRIGHNLRPRFLARTSSQKSLGENCMSRAGTLLARAALVLLACGVALSSASRALAQQEVIDAVGMMDFSGRPNFHVGSWVKYHT